MSDCIDHGRVGNKQGYTSARPTGGEHAVPLHRLVWSRYNNTPLNSIKGLVVRHTCDNTRCINPEHLELGTYAQNSQDMVNRGRSIRGTAHSDAVLSEEDVRRIRQIYVKSSREFGSIALAKQYGVGGSTIRKIIAGTTWKHLKD